MADVSDSTFIVIRVTVRFIASSRRNLDASLAPVSIVIKVRFLAAGQRRHKWERGSGNVAARLSRGNVAVGGGAVERIGRCQQALVSVVGVAGGVAKLVRCRS